MKEPLFNFKLINYNILKDSTFYDAKIAPMNNKNKEEIKELIFNKIIELNPKITVEMIKVHKINYMHEANLANIKFSITSEHYLK